MVSDLRSRFYYREDSLSYEMLCCLHLFPFSLYIRGKVGFESSRMVLFYRIKLDLTNRVGNKKEFQQSSYPSERVWKNDWLKCLLYSVKRVCVFE